MRASLFPVLLVLFCACPASHAKTDPRWTTPLAPFRIADNLYYVGSQGQDIDLLPKLRRYPQEGPRVFIDPAGYQGFVTHARQEFEQALKKQQADPSG